MPPGRSSERPLQTGRGHRRHRPPSSLPLATSVVPAPRWSQVRAMAPMARRRLDCACSGGLICCVLQRSLDVVMRTYSFWFCLVLLACSSDPPVGEGADSPVADAEPTTDESREASTGDAAAEAGDSDVADEGLPGTASDPGQVLDGPGGDRQGEASDAGHGLGGRDVATAEDSEHSGVRPGKSRRMERPGRQHGRARRTEVTGRFGALVRRRAARP